MDTRSLIPNNVGLSENPALRRLLEAFRPEFLNWWRDAGPTGFDAHEVYLRTPTGIDSQGWASYGFTRLEEFRWGIYQAQPVEGRVGLFGGMAGKPVWQSIPDEHRDYFRKAMVTQGDTEPGSVEQSRLLGLTAPSLYDLRNLLQINVEEGRHLWAMVHLLFEHLGAEGRDEAEGLLTRRSGSAEQPRILEAFNSAIDEWLSFLIWSFLADRDGKYQLMAMSESAFDPIARTTKFMLTEEAHHMFVGETGLQRVIERTVQLMREHDTDDVAPHGGISLVTLQRYFNYWTPQIIDLFGSEFSKKAAHAFDAGLKGRAFESQYDEHVRLDAPIEIERLEGGRLAPCRMTVRDAINEVLRREYLSECERIMTKWNRLIARAGIDFTLRLPDKRFNRRIGIYAGLCFTPEGKPIDRAAFEAGLAGWLPSEAERRHVIALMQPVYEPGKIAGWIAPPARGVNGLPVDYTYVRAA